MVMIDASQWVNIAVVCAIMALFAGIGFNRPSWSRSFTTAASYYTAQVAYIIGYLVLLLIVYRILLAIHGWRGSTDTADHASLLSARLALGLTLVIHYMRSLGGRLRGWVHGLADIPGCAQRLSNRLLNAEFNTAVVGNEARALLMARGVDVGTDWLPIVQSAQKQLLVATALFIQLRKWEATPGCARFALEARNDIDLLRRRFDRMSFRVSRTLASIERLGELRHLFATPAGDAQAVSAKADDLLRKIVGDLIAESCDDIGLFYGDACLMAARGALAMKSTREGRDRLMSDLGFVLDRNTGVGLLGFLVRASMLLILGLTLFFLVLPAPKVSIGPKAIFMVIALNVFGALAIAIVPKLRWGFANSGLWRKTPVSFVLGAALGAAVFATLVNLCTGALLLGGVDGALDRLREGSLALPALMITAGTVAWLVQDHRWYRAPSEQRRRLYDAATWGAAWLVASIVSWPLQVATQDASFGAQTIGTWLAALLFGGVLGYAVPESIRTRGSIVAGRPTGRDLPEFIPSERRTMP
jgi:hypothetical protein